VCAASRSTKSWTARQEFRSTFCGILFLVKKVALLIQMLSFNRHRLLTLCAPAWSILLPRVSFYSSVGCIHPTLWFSRRNEGVIKPPLNLMSTCTHDSQRDVEKPEGDVAEREGKRKPETGRRWTVVHEGWIVWRGESSQRKEKKTRLERRSINFYRHQSPPIVRIITCIIFLEYVSHPRLGAFHTAFGRRIK